MPLLIVPCNGTISKVDAYRWTGITEGEVEYIDLFIVIPGDRLGAIQKLQSSMTLPSWPKA